VFVTCDQGRSVALPHGRFGSFVFWWRSSLLSGRRAGQVRETWRGGCLYAEICPLVALRVGLYFSCLLLAPHGYD